MQDLSTRTGESRTVRDLLEMGFRHKWKALAFFIAVVATTLVILAFTPGEYTSTAKLMVRRGREDAFLSPSASGPTHPLYKEWESEVNTELEILRSRELVLAILDSFGYEQLTRKSPPPRSGILHPVRATLNPARNGLTKLQEYLAPKPAEPSSSTGSDHEGKAVQMIEKSLLVEARKKSDIITVSYTATDPELAQQVVAELVEVYLDRRINVHRVPGAHQFFGQQTEQLMWDLKKSEESIYSLKTRAGIVSLEDSRQALLTARGTVRELQLQNESALAAANARVQLLRTMLTDPAQNKSPVSSALLDRTEHQELQTSLRTDEIEQAALVAQSQELGHQMAQLKLELEQLNMLDAPMRTLQREQALLEEKYHKYSGNKEQARINEELETRKISNVSIVQHATLPTDPNPPSKAVKLLAALFMGMIGAIVTTFGADYVDPTLHSSTDVSGRLGLKTVLELPRMRRDALLPVTHSNIKKRHNQPKHGRDNLVSDYFQELLFKVTADQPLEKNEPLVVGVTSSTSGEGVSSITANLAAAFANDERFDDILCLDASRKSPQEKSSDKAKKVPTSYRHINDSLPLNDAESKGEGKLARFTGQLERAKEQGFNVIVVDLPPTGQNGDTIRMAASLDVTLLVVAAESIHWRAALKSIDYLNDAHANLGGVVLNKRNHPMPQWLYRKI